jgi:hypothetical protein
MDILWKRPTEWQPVDYPCELGYQCPICKIERDELLNWSEYNYCLRCPRCELDIPSCLCKQDIKANIETFMQTIKHLLSNHQN